MAPQILLSSEVSFQHWWYVNSFSSVCVEIYEIRQNTVSQQQDYDQTVSVYCVDFCLLDKVTNEETNPHTWNVTAASVKELDWLAAHKFIWLFIDLFTVLARITVWNPSHVHIRIHICPDHAAQKSQKAVKNQVTTWGNFIALAVRITSQRLKHKINQVEKCVQKRSADHCTQMIL